MKMKSILLMILFSTVFIFAESKVVMNGAPVRLNHTVSAPVVATIEAKTEIVILESYSVWTKINIIDGSIHTGKTGWVFSPLLNGDSIGGKGSNVRTEPSSSSTILFSVKGGATITKLEYKYTWYKVSYKNMTGWIYSANFE